MSFHFLLSLFDPHYSLKSHWIQCLVSLGFDTKHAHILMFLILVLDKSCILIQEYVCWMRFMPLYV